MTDLPEGFVLEGAVKVTSGPPVPEGFVIEDGPNAPTVEQSDEMGAEVSDTAVASLADDPRARMRYFAKERFPDDPNAVKRYGMVGGQIVYRGEDGKIYAEVPNTDSFTGYARQAASTVGPSIPMVTGAVGGVATIPVYGGVPGAMLGAMGGQAAREGLANVLMDQEVDVGRVATEGALEAGGQAVGFFIAKGLSKALATKAARQVDEYVRRAGMDAVDALKKAADDFGIKLTPAELTGAPRLRGEQKALSALPDSAGVMEGFYVNRGRAANEAVEGELKALSPVDDIEDAGAMLRDKAGEAMGAAKAQRAMRGSPAYQQAFAEAGPVDVAPVTDVIQSKMATAGRTTRRYLNVIKKELDAVGKEGGSLEALQNRVKEEIDNQIGTAIRQGNGKSAAALQDVKSSLLDTMDAASPKFKAARQQWGDLSEDVTRAQGGALAEIAKMGDTRLKDVSRKLLTSGPSTIRDARARIVKLENGQEAWDAIARAYLEDAFDRAGKVAMSNVSKPQAAEASRSLRWWAEAFGDKRQQARLRAALSPDQFKSLRKLMDVLEATGRAMDFNSDTAFKQEVISDLRRQAGGGIIGNVNLLAVLRKMEGAYRDYRFGRNVGDLAEAITSRDAIQELKNVQKMSPKSKRAIIAAAHALGLTVRGDDSEEIPIDQPQGQ